MRQPDGLPKVSLIPSIGDRVEVMRIGISLRGTVQYADWLQVLVKWDDGSSSSLRVGRDTVCILDEARNEESPDA